MNKIFAVSLVSAATLGAQAQAVTNTAPVRELSLKDCIQQALAHNFDVQIQRYNPIIQESVLNGDYGGYDPNLDISGLHSHNVAGPDGFPPFVSDSDSFSSQIGGVAPWGTQYAIGGNVAETSGSQFSTTTATLNNPDSTSGNVGASITQPLLRNLWIDSTRLAIEVDKNKLQQTREVLRGQFITTVAAVQNAYYELIYAFQNVTVQQEALTLAQTQLDQDRQRVQVGSLAPLDVQQDEAQVASSKANLIAAQNTLSIDENTLKNLLTDSYRQWQGISIRPAESLSSDLRLFDLQDSWGKAMTKQPLLLEARLEVTQLGIDLKFDRNQLYPELDLKGSYGFNGTGQEFNDAFNQFREANRPYYTYGAEISIPLSNIKARSALKAGKATLQQELLTLKQIEQNVLVAVDNAVKQVASDYEAVQASKQATMYAAAALDAEQKKYNVGKSTTFTVLQLQNTLTTDRGTEIRNIANYDEDIAKLAQNEGTTLDELNITLDIR